MQLFHYHWWTDKVEAMEEFYKQMGFKTVIRAGRFNGEMQTFNPPLTWDDFRGKNITFRIIEMVKGQTNLTFGYGTKDRFDHIGLLVNEEEYLEIIERAHHMNGKVMEGERRTFISTPYNLRIELQKRSDVVTEENHTRIHSMEIGLPFGENPEWMADLLNLRITEKQAGKMKLESDHWSLIFNKENKVRLISVVYQDGTWNSVDPAGTKLVRG